jgi:hypothetical protein
MSHREYAYGKAACKPRRMDSDYASFPTANPISDIPPAGA